MQWVWGMSPSLRFERGKADWSCVSVVSRSGRDLDDPRSSTSFQLARQGLQGDAKGTKFPSIGGLFQRPTLIPLDSRAGSGSSRRLRHWFDISLVTGVARVP